MQSMNLESIPRLKFAHLPTPVEHLPRLSAAYGPDLWIKRDDQTGLAFGGNKTRKLEFLVADARAQGACTLITRGAAQSNHCRQTAAAAACHGLNCSLVLTGDPADQWTGNLLLDHLLNVEMVWTEGADPDTILQQTFDAAQSDGRHPYLIPYGGSNPLGACAYAAALHEFRSQNIDVNRIVLASSSGGTQAGLVAAARLLNDPLQITGISVDPKAEPLKKIIAELATQTTDLLGEPQQIEQEDIDVRDEFLGEGYGVVGDLEREAIQTFARLEGILLDPVYTGRAAGGMLDLIQREEFSADESILFWHTGGTPAIFAYNEALL
jgi:D-cysteine desulfhydrase family pyridoxal phosphate-dependent enzyme